MADSPTDRLIAEDPELKVVIREWPIFEGSDVASRMALAAGLQGKYRAFHDAMFATKDVAAAARAAGLDMARAEEDNHVPNGYVRNLWLPVNRDVGECECECKADERPVRVPFGGASVNVVPPAGVGAPSSSAR